MTLGEQARWWGAGLVLVGLLLWLLADALLPFILGMAIAYLTDPLADRLERMGLSRLMAVIVITIVTIGVVVLAVLLLLPSLVEQTQAALQNLPGHIADGRRLVADWLPESVGDSAILRDAIEAVRANAEAWSVTVLQRLLSGGLALIDFVLILVVTPVVAFYLLYDWDRMIAEIDEMLPRQHRGTIRRLAREIDDVLAGFVRGQGTVCVILGTFYAVALSVVGLDFGLLIGFFAGLVSFIPYVGSVLGGLLSVGVAAVQFWNEPIWIGVVAAIFVVGQAVEGNILTPNLVGGKVKLHPVWLMFALAAFGTVFGFIGLLVAVPVAAVIGVLGRFALERYKAGPLYRGSPVLERHQRIARAREAPEPPDPPDPDLTSTPEVEVYETPAEELHELRAGDPAAPGAGSPGKRALGAAADDEAGR